MPISINGVGTKYYGRRDFGPDGSFVTTEWVVLFHFPIIPIRSFRALYRGQENVAGPFYQRGRYSVSRPKAPNWKQVLCVYLYSASLLAFASISYLSYERLAGQFGPAPIIIAMVLGSLGFLLAPGLLRAPAMRRAGLRPDRKKTRRRRSREPALASTVDRTEDG